MEATQNIIWSQLAIDYKCEFAEGGYHFLRDEKNEPTRLVTKFPKPDILARKFTAECLRDFLSIYPGYSKYKKSKELIITGLEDFHSKWGVFPNTENEPNFVKGSEASLLLIVKKRRYLTRYKRDSDQYDAEFEELVAKTKTAQKDERISKDFYEVDFRAAFNFDVQIGIKDMGTQFVPSFQPTNLLQALEIALVLGWHLEAPIECKSFRNLGDRRPTNCSRYFTRKRSDKEFCSDDCRGSYHRIVKREGS
jgi:hypothetical protein